MKISLKLANGAELDFEGDGAEFERVSRFLEAPPDSLTAAPPARGPGLGNAPGDPNGGSESDAPLRLEPATVAERLEQVGARTDQERVTVMAQLAMESGAEGLDYASVEVLYTELAFRKPSRFAKTFSNAKTSGLVKSVKPGVWRPTYRGENYARGLGRGERPGRRSSARPKASPDTGGGESD